MQCLFHYRDQGTYLLHEFVVMPNHLHLLLTPSADTSLEKAIQLIKGGSSHEIYQQRGHKMQIWHPGFHEQTVRDERDYRNKAEYIRMNPVRSYLAETPNAWLPSSAASASELDPTPQQFKIVASGAKAQISNSAVIVGAKAPTP